MHKYLALAVLCAGAARGAGPSYSAAGIVNASSFGPGPFAPGSVMSIFGAGLARSTYAIQNSDLVACGAISGHCLPPELNFARVYVQDQPVGMLFVSPSQINFVLPGVELPGDVTVRVVTEGISGPYITVTLVPAAPALFPQGSGYAIATSAVNQLLTAANPAHAGDTIVIYLTGLGVTTPNPSASEIPNYAALMIPATLSSLRVTLAGAAVDPTLIKYAGLTPGSAGLYQINLYIPSGTGTDPEIQVFAGTVASQAGLKLPVQ
jgi:uncharacterized protein (TIGR03437 family)